MENNNNKLVEAIKYFHEGEYEVIAPVIIEAANKNIIQAMELYGLMLQFGLGVERNIPNAIKVFENAADLGSGVAAHNLGTLYITCGIEGVANLNKSKKWFEKAIDLGFIVGK